MHKFCAFPSYIFICYICITMTIYMTKITDRKKYLTWRMISEDFSDCGREAMLASLLPDNLLHGSRSIWQRLLTHNRNKKPSQKIGRNQGPAYNCQRPAPSDLLQPVGLTSVKKHSLRKACHQLGNKTRTFVRVFYIQTIICGICRAIVNVKSWRRYIAIIDSLTTYWMSSLNGAFY